MTNAELGALIADWCTWAEGNEDALLGRHEIPGPRWPSSVALARFPHGASDEIWQRGNLDIEELLVGFALPRTERIESMQRHMTLILSDGVLKKQLLDGQVFSRTFRRLRSDYERLRGELFEKARDRGSRSTPQSLALMAVWFSQLRVLALHARLHAELQNQVSRLEWKLSDFDFIEEMSQRTAVQLAPSSQTLASYDLQTLDGVLRMVFRVVMEAGLVSVGPFLEFWRSLWQQFVSLLDSSDASPTRAHPIGPSTLHPTLVALRKELFGGLGATLQPTVVAVSDSRLNQPYLTGPTDTETIPSEDVRLNRLPEALPFRHGDRQLLLPGMFEYDCLYFHMDQLVQLLERYELAAQRTVPIATARNQFAECVRMHLLANRQAAGVAAQLLQEEIIQKRDTTLTDALYHAIFRRLSDLFMYPGEAELYTLHQLFSGSDDSGNTRGSSSRLSSIHDEPFSGHVLSALRAADYARAARTHENENLLDDIIEKVWKTGGQTLAEGCMPPLERIANVVLLELVDKIMAAQQCPEPMRIKANCFLDYMTYNSVYPKLLTRAPPPTIQALRLSGNCMCRLVQIVRRNFIIIPAADTEDAVHVFEVASFPAAVIVWLSFARFDTMSDKRQRDASIREPLRFLPAQLRPLVETFKAVGAAMH